jgi:hypothetical protein
MFWPFGRRALKVLAAPVTVPAPTPLLPQDVPLGCYLLERAGPVVLLWRISEGEPAEDALDPSQLYPTRAMLAE